VIALLEKKRFKNEFFQAQFSNKIKNRTSMPISLATNLGAASLIVC
jgi:hypothetical protein